MAPPPGPEFADAVADLPAADLAALVAAVHETRGWAVERDGTDVLATPPRADRPLRLAVRGGADDDTAPRSGTDPSVPAGTDRLVVPTRAPDAGDDVLDATDLRAMVVHALDPADRARICRRFFDRDPGAFGDASPGRDADDGDPPDDDVDHGDSGWRLDSGGSVASDVSDAPADSRSVTPASDAPETDAPRVASDARPDAVDGRDPHPGDVARTLDDADATDADRPDREGASDAGHAQRSWSPRQVTLLGAAVALVLAGVVTAGPALVGDAARPTGGSNLTATGGWADTRTGPSMKASFPPGVGAGGVTDAASLAEAHGRVLSGRSYRVRIVHREYADGRLRGVARERIVVADTDHYRSRVTTNGTVEHATAVVGESSTYANGPRVYLRPTGGRDIPESAAHRHRMVGTTEDPNRFVDRTRRYVRWYLSVEESRVLGSAPRDGTTTLWIALSGDPWPGSTNVTGTARVDERGLVRSIRREYSPAGSPSVRVTVTVRITPGPVTVTRPAWADGWNGTTPTANRPERP